MSWYEQGGSSEPPQSPPPGTPSQSPPPAPDAAPPPPPVDSAYGTPPQSARTEGTAIASLVLGIISLFLFGIILGVIAIVLGLKAKKKIEASGGQLGGAGLATAGTILGILGIIGSVIVLAVFIS